MKFAPIVMILFLPVCALSATFVQTTQLALPAEGIYELRIHCGAGSLYITNAEWRDEITVFADIEVEDLSPSDSKAFTEKNVVLNLDKKANRALLKSDLKRPLRQSPEARINLTIEVPPHIDVFIDDGSGPIHIQHFSGHLDIKDNSGLITLENVVGSVRVADDSGKIIVEDIQGNVEIKDGSGSVSISKIRGDVRVTDGSGSISIQYVDGNVTVTDASGAIDINDIAGNVFIRESGTGELNIERIKGKVTTRP